MALFTKDNMIMDLQGTTQKEILEDLAKKAYAMGAVQDAAALVSDYLAREEESTTGFGNGVAIQNRTTTSKQRLFSGEASSRLNGNHLMANQRTHSSV